MDPPLDAMLAPWLSAHGPAACLVFGRVAGLVSTAPAFAGPGLDWRYRFLLAGMLTVVLVPILEPTIGATAGAGATAWGLAGELLAGGLLGTTAGLVVAAARQAGDLVAAQAGLSAASLFDPENGEEVTALGHLYGLLALATFLAMDGPLVAVRALVESYRAIPAGGLALDSGLAAVVAGQVGRALGLALQAAAPPAVALGLAGLVVGWLGRLAPAVPFTSLALAIRSCIGLVLVLLGLGTAAATLSGAWLRWPSW